MNFNNYVNIIKERLSPSRAAHSLRVVKTALKMADGKKVDKDKVYLAALLHDYAKDLPPQELLAVARQNHLLTCQAEEMQPDLLHGPVGAWLCRNDLRVDDEEVLLAIHYHTTGRVNMSMLDIIIYLADLVEPGRKYQGVDKLRSVCASDLARGMLCAFDSTIRYVLEREFLIHPLTIEARNWLLASKLNLGE
ncbi:MAG: bis(5'-nucleosyl)-tetraphosphatase (symmetrical) YqeK [Peptococcaceae bacterium]|jgi:predicted HD superfamily hydrolase involved in NAD metabolism|nr:bis(5'-nucleosyl)-tetraphosphatase (symmetrical) YqeK [Peptococcaceae bacterium]MDH7524424.1 bis(5'-nucleosyl)-tetraphosphatase (symmetrical) YqeK [Peptococcaceae bacterium]